MYYYFRNHLANCVSIEYRYICRLPLSEYPYPYHMASFYFKNPGGVVLHAKIIKILLDRRVLIFSGTFQLYGLHCNLSLKLSNNITANESSRPYKRILLTGYEVFLHFHSIRSVTDSLSEISILFTRLIHNPTRKSLLASRISHFTGKTIVSI